MEQGAHAFFSGGDAVEAGASSAPISFFCRASASAVRFSEQISFMMRLL